MEDANWIWKKEIDDISIAHERGLKTARKVEKILAFAFGVLFVAIGGVSIFNEFPAELGALSEPNPAVLAVSFGLLACFYGLYITKHSEESRMQEGDISTLMTDDAMKVVEDAFLLAYRMENLSVGPLHLLVAALGSVPGQVLLARLGISLESVKDPLRRKLLVEEKGPTVFDARAKEVLEHAYRKMLEVKADRLTPLEIFAAAYEADPFFTQLFEEKGITEEELKNALAWIHISETLSLRYKALRKAASLKPTGNMDRAMTAVATPFLDAVSEDLTRDAVFGRTSLLIGRENETNALFRAIEGGFSSVVLVGPSGVGKGAIIEGIADLMVEERVPRILQDKRLLKISVPHIVSAQGGQGAEERFLYALEQVARTGNVVLVIEDIHELVGSGGGIDLASILATELEKGYTFVIATTTPEGYSSAVERSVLGQKLTKITIDEPERNAAIRILESKIGNIEARNNAAFTYGAVAALVDLSSRYMHDRVLPEKAIELAKEVALSVGKRGTGLQWVSKEDVAALVGEKTKIPVTQVTQDEGQKLLQLEEKLHERVIGQEAAVKSVSSALRRARTELRSEGKPIANFLFLGPTGVGKTELAKATAEVFFGSEQSMVRFDMSEYQNKDSVNRLIGGNGEAGLMTEAIRKNPFSLLLLDELEKAHPDILNLFLQVMDDGRLTDGLGRTIDFTNVILIATSNAGTRYIQDEVMKGTAPSLIKDALVNNELRQLYRPEFLNRFNDIIVFSPLTEADVTAIAYLLIAKVQKRMEAKNITLEVTDAAIHELAKAGYDPKFGARPLRRVIEERVENLLADELLKGAIGRRDTVIFDANGKFEVKKAQLL